MLSVLMFGGNFKYLVNQTSWKILEWTLICFVYRPGGTALQTDQRSEKMIKYIQSALLTGLLQVNSLPGARVDIILIFPNTSNRKGKF